MDTPLSARTALLYVLNTPGHGRELMDRMERESRGLVRPRQGSVYPALRQLEGDGLVRSWLVPPRARAGRPRRYYELTIKGVGAAAAQRDALRAFIAGAHGLPASADEPEPMRERLQRCAELSAACIELRQAAEALS